MGASPSKLDALRDDLSVMTTSTFLAASRGPLNLVSVLASDSLSDAVEKLQAGGVTGAPVVSPGDDGLAVLIGQIDMADIVRAVVGLCGSGADRAELFFSVPVTEAMSPAATIAPGASLQALAQSLTGGRRRAVVVGPGGEPLGMVSQSDVIGLLVKEFMAGRTQALEGMTMMELRLGVDTPVVTAPASLTALEAFGLVTKWGISAVPVTDPATGRAVGSLSVTDLKGLTPASFQQDLSLPVLDFLAKCRNLVSAPPIGVRQTATFSQVLEGFAANSVHRLWILDTEGIPSGVISLEDIIKLLKDLLE